MRKKPSVLKDLLFLSISSFIVVVAWVGFNLYHSYVTTTITPELQIQIVPINPNFDTAMLEKLKARKQVAPITELSSVTFEPTPRVESTTQIIPATTIAPTPIVSSPAPPIVSDIPVTVNGQ
jgi:hypothetical protein